jgi:hypothetical protein
MADFLGECFRRSRRLGIVQQFMATTNAKYEEDQMILYNLCSKSTFR